VARVIAEAAVRLGVDRKGLAGAMRREFRAAIKEASAGGSLFDDIDRDSERAATRAGSRWTSVLGGLKSSLGGLLAGFAGTGKLLLLGTAAAGALAGIVSLTTAVSSLGGALLTASGVAGLLPAALAGLAAIKGTLALGLSGVSEGFKAVGQDAAAFNEAIKDLAPNAQGFLRAIRDQKGAFDALKLDVQNRLFAGLGDAIQPLAERYLPLARDLFGGIADELNVAGHSMIDFALNAETVGQTSNLFGNLRQAVANLAPAFAPAVSALLDITETGSRFLPGMTQHITELSTRFAEFIRNAAGDGRLEAFFQRAIDTVKQLGRIAGNVFEGLGNVMDAARSQGAGLLNTIETITQAFADWTGSTTGQDALRSFFESMQRVVKALGPAFFELITVIGRDFIPILADIATTIGPVLRPLFETFGRLLQALRPLITAIAQAFATALEALGPFFDALGRAITEAMPVLGPLIQDIGEAFANLFEAMVPLAPLFVQLLEAVLPIVPPLIQMIADIMPSLIELIQALLPVIQAWVDMMVQLIPMIAPVVNFLLSVFIPVIELIANIISGLLTVFTAVFTGIWNVVTTVFTAIADFFVAIWNGIKDFFTGAINGIKDFFSGGLDGMWQKTKDFGANLWSSIKDAMSNMVSAIGDGIANALAFFRDLPGKILDFFKGAGQWLYNVGKDILMGLWNGLKAMVDRIIGFFRDLVGQAKNIVMDLLGIASPSKEFEWIGKMVGEGMIKGIAGITPAVGAAAAAMAGAVLDAAAMENPLAVGTVAGASRGVPGDGYTVVHQTNVMRAGADVKQFSDLVLKRGMGDFLSGASTLSVARKGVQAGVNDQWVGA
jgi:phage-related protein